MVDWIDGSSERVMQRLTEELLNERLKMSVADVLYRPSPEVGRPFVGKADAQLVFHRSEQSGLASLFLESCVPSPSYCSCSVPLLSLKAGPDCPPWIRV